MWCNTSKMCFFLVIIIMAIQNITTTLSSTKFQDIGDNMQALNPFVYSNEHHNHNQQQPQQNGPLFILEPSSKVHFSNSTGTVIPCAASGMPSVRISWVLADGSQVIDVNGLRYVRSNGELVFPPFPSSQYRQDIHSTIYRCVASNTFGTIRSRDCHVRAVVHQAYKIQVYDDFVINANTAVMRCQVPTFVREYVNIISWLKDDKVLITSSTPKGFGRYLILSSGELQIINASKNDMGSYKCQTRHQLTNEVVVSTGSGRLVVTEPQGGIPPRIWSHSQVKCIETEFCELACVAQSWPTPKYRWYKEEDSAVLTSIVIGKNVQQYDGTIIINRVSSSDSGKWVCVANNSLGEEKVIIKLVVISQLVVHIEPQRLEVDIAKSATFNCTQRGSPINLPVSWFKDGRPLTNDPFNNGFGDERIRLIDHNILHIRSVIREDSGSYQCLAQSEYDSSQATAELKLGDISPVILESFKDNIIAESGSPLSLRCMASASPLPQIKWFLDDWPVPNLVRFRVGDYVTHDAKLVSFVNITSTRVVDGGEYKCVASNDIGSASYSGLLSVIGIPTLRSMWTSNNLTVVAGHSVVLRCPVIAYPIESLAWEHKGNTLPVNHRHKIDQLINGIGGKLHITSVHKTLDAGEYICTVKGTNGKPVKGSIILNVRLPPQIDEHSLPQHINTKQGMRVKLMCSIVEGDPPIDIRWFKGFAPVLPTETISLQNSEDYSVLTFKSVTHQDMGNWTCSAWNDVESVNRTTMLTVNVSPSWKIEPKNVYVVLGKGVCIDCSAEGYPNPRISWKKSITSSVTDASNSGNSADKTTTTFVPSEFKDILSSYRHQVYANGTLFIQEVDKSDAGYYMCKISNEIGADLSKVIQLYVQIPPHFESKFISESVKKGTNAILQCKPHGDPVIKAVWQKDKQTLDSFNDRRYSIKEEIISAHYMISYLEILNVGRHDSALYTCLVSNDYGADDTNIQLIVQEIPEPPHELSVKDVTSRSVIVTWKSSFSGNSAIIRYIAQFRNLCLADKEWQELSTNTGNENKLYLRPLQPMCAYEIQMRAENGLGRSDSSAAIVITTSEEVPGGPPLGVIVEATSSTSLKIKWKPPLKEVQYGKIKGYYIGYKVANYDTETFQYKNVEAINDNDGTKYEISYITNLVRKTPYIIIVQAYNSIGAGPRSDEVRIMTLESQPPRSPLLEVVTTTKDSISLRWDINEYDVDEKEYILFFKEDKVNDWQQRKLRTKLNHYVLDSKDGRTQIKCGTKYKLYMTATNSLGTGEPSEMVTTQTKGAAPLSPSKEEFIFPNSTSVLLKLSSWQTVGCPILMFTIKYKIVHHQQWNVLNEKATHGYDVYQIHHLISGRVYDLQVGAHSDAGVTEAEYQFATLNTSLVIKIGSIQPPNSVSSHSSVSLSIFHNITVMLPIVISVIVLIAVLSTLVVFMRKQNSANHHNLEPRNSIPKSELSSEIFPLNDFVSTGSKPKLFESHTASGNDIYGKASSFYATPNRKSIPSSLLRHINSGHEYAEPHAQYSQPRCLFGDDSDCANLSNCALMLPNTAM